MGFLLDLWNRVTPKRQMSTCLFLIAASAVLFTRQYNAIFTILISFTTAFVADSIFIRIRKIKPFVLSASVVSGLIIGLTLSPNLPWYYFVIAGTFAMATKNFIRFQDHHVFNPAASGLVLTTILFGKDISWWGVSFQSFRINAVSILLVIILLTPGLISFIRMRRYRIILSFWVTYILLLLVFKVGLNPDPTVLFFSLVMLPEPMTTPNYPVRQILFGPFVALSSFIFGSLAVGLLIGNAIFFILNFLTGRFNMAYER